MRRKQPSAPVTGYLTPASSLSSTSRKRSASTDSSSHSICNSSSIKGKIVEEEEIDRIELSPPSSYAHSHSYTGIAFNYKRFINSSINNVAPSTLKSRNLRPRLIKSTTSDRNQNDRFSSSWPYRGNSKSSASINSYSDFLQYLPAELTKCLRNEHEIKAVNCTALKRALVSEFKYIPAFDAVEASKCTSERLFSRQLWNSLKSVAEIYTGHEDKHIQNRTEVSLAAWTTVLRLCANGNVRGIEQFRLVSIAAVLVQAKLLDEADVSYPKLVRRLTISDSSICIEKLKKAERRVTEQLNWKLLYPGPHVLLFLFLDTFSQVFPLPPPFKHLIARVLDILIEEDFVRFTEMLRSCSGRASLIVFEVIILVVSDLYSTLNCCTQDDILRLLLKALDEETKSLLFGFEFGHFYTNSTGGVSVYKEWAADLEFKLNVLAAIDKIAL